MVELAEQLGSVSQALGFSRESFYRFQDVPEKGGEAARIEAPSASKRLCVERVAALEIP